MVQIPWFTEAVYSKGNAMTTQTTQSSIVIRRSSDRGFFDHGWLKAFHSFSFGQYRDRQWDGFGSLRVINQDTIAPRMGFGEHGHRDMEIITYPVSGSVRHRDSLGNEEDITHGMIQRMSAGSGIRHSEFNPLDSETHLLQIWIEPRETGITPTHESKRFPILEETGKLHLLASADGEGGSLKIEQDAKMSAGIFNEDDSVSVKIRESRQAWVQVIRGSANLTSSGTIQEGYALKTGDGAAISHAEAIELVFTEESEVLVFELG
jgi:quercetin 2,3-dioxygenase